MLHDGARMVTFETEGLLSLDEKAVVPTLLYLFRRIERRLNGAPTMIILDEAWSYLRHPLFYEQLRDWLKTMRKKNVVVILATQQISDLAGSSIADVVIENCPTKILLPNPEAKTEVSREFYRKLGLNVRELDLISTAIPKQHYYITSTLGRRMVDFGIGPVGRAFVGVNGHEEREALAEMMRAYPENWRIRWLENKKEPAWAQYLESLSVLPVPA
jgi:type IV secretion system protein VirB4